MLYWLGSPSLILICVAAGVRNAGGYVWGNYTPLFFSPLYTFQKVSSGVAGIGGSSFVSCTSSFAAGMPNSTSMCAEGFPYCVKESMRCAKLSQTPWHDQVCVGGGARWDGVGTEAEASTAGKGKKNQRAKRLTFF